jgi:hypothetical protein
MKTIAELMKDRTDTVKVLIATPFYESKAFINYLGSIVQTIETLCAVKIGHELLFINGDSYIDRARNSIVSLFLHDKRFADKTHLFFIDSDMRWDVQGFLRVLFAYPDFVGSAYPMKNKWEAYGAIIKTNNDNGSLPGTPKCNEGGLIEAEIVPGGFMRLSRACCERLEAAMFKEENWYMDNTSAHCGKTANIFECRVKKGLGAREGEDTACCHKWAELGGVLYCEPRITFGHVGVKEFTGNFHEFLLKQPQPDPNKLLGGLHITSDVAKKELVTEGPTPWILNDPREEYVAVR